MVEFPKSVLPPESVDYARIERKRHLLRGTGWGIGIRTLVIAFEMGGFIYFGSQALLMDALSSLIDVVCSLLLLLFIQLAGRPPDANHPFGHGRYEPLAGLQLGMLLTLVGGGMLIQQLFQWANETKGGLDPKAWIIPFIALILLEICYAITSRLSKEHDSPALAAEAAHYRIDSLTSLMATLALIAAAFFPHWGKSIDHIGAIAIAILMIGMGAFASLKNMHQLLDTIPSSQYFNTVRKAARQVVGVMDTEKIRIQLYGPDAQVNIDIEVDPQLSVEKAHRISQLVRAEIQKEWPAVRDVSVHIEPFYPGDH